MCEPLPQNCFCDRPSFVAWHVHSEYICYSYAELDVYCGVATSLAVAARLFLQNGSCSVMQLSFYTFPMDEFYTLG